MAREISSSRVRLQCCFLIDHTEDWEHEKNDIRKEGMDQLRARRATSLGSTMARGPHPLSRAARCQPATGHRCVLKDFLKHPGDFHYPWEALGFWRHWYSCAIRNRVVRPVRCDGDRKAHPGPAGRGGLHSPPASSAGTRDEPLHAIAVSYEIGLLRIEANWMRVHVHRTKIDALQPWAHKDDL